MFFVALLSLCCAVDRSYSIYAPFDKTNLSEIGNWTMKGTTVNMKTFLRLTSSSIMNECGAICHRVPTIFHDWIIDLEVKIAGTNETDSLTSFLFTSDVCPEPLGAFEGVRITINTREEDAHGNVLIGLYENGDANVLQKGSIRAKNTEKPVHLRISREQNTISVDRYEDGQAKTVITANLADMPRFGYFTVTAESDGSTPDAIDLIAFRTQPMSEYETPEFDEKLLNFNRKIIESGVLRRREMKLERRAQILPNTQKYLTEMFENNNELTDDEDDVNLDAAFELIWEAEQRGISAVTINELKQFIIKTMGRTVDKAMRKLDLAFENFDESKTDMTSIWSYLRVQIRELAIDSRREMRKLERECAEAVKNLDLKTVLSKNQEPETDIVSMILGIIAATEVILYMLFFFIRHAKTKGFQKVD